MEAVSSAAMLKALDSLLLRFEYTSQNIANANTPGYEAMSVSFEEMLKTAAEGDVNAIESVVPKTQISENNNLNSEMRLDLELATAAQTSMRFSALIDIMGRQISLARTVVRGSQ